MRICKFPRVLLGLTWVASSLLVSQSADAFCRATDCAAEPGNLCFVNESGCMPEGLPLGWPQGAEVILGVEDEDDLSKSDRNTLAATLEAAALEWLETECDEGRPELYLEGADEVEDGEVGRIPAPIFVKLHESKWPYGDNVLGKTILDYDLDSGELLDAVIYINGELVPIKEEPDEDEADLLALVTHEFGHALGLDHSREEGATMQAITQIEGMSKLRTINSDDKNGLCSLYPGVVSYEYEVPPDLIDEDYIDSGSPGASGCSVALTTVGTRQIDGGLWVLCVGALAWSGRRRRSATA